MRNSLLILLVIFVACSNDDNVAVDNTNKEIVLSQAWETETDPFLMQGLAVDDNSLPYFYVATKSGGLLIFQDSATDEPNQVATVPIDELSNLHATNIFHSANYI